jgi:predicted AAA+ superfamily ATPase
MSSNSKDNMFKRLLNMQLPGEQSAFLWGARQTGKTSYLAIHFPQATTYDLLDTYQMMRLTKSPWLLREEVSALSKNALQHPIIIDEIQKVPALLNEVHWLIENLRAQFILCGSSARKLKIEAANLLGGRAWKYHFYPLVSAEIPNFNLLRALQHGLIPKHYLSDPTFINEYLEAYIDVYLTDEIRNEGLVRNLAGFARFLDVAGLTNGEMVNHTNVARDCGIDRATVSGFYQILIDTLIGYYVYPYNKKIKRDLITAMPKFYLFDVGLANYLARQSVLELRGNVAGKSFEHFIMMELTAYLSYHRKREKICYWRTKTGLEVDFIIGEAKVAIEIKIDAQVHKQDIKGLIAFCEEHPHTLALVVSQDIKKRKLTLENGQSIMIIPWQLFLTELWAGDII